MDNSNNPFTVSRATLVYGLTLPVAALLGYLLADSNSNLMVLVVVVGLAILPLMMRWYHPVLVLVWNAPLYVTLLPGQPQWWMVATLFGGFFVVVNRCVDPRRRLMVGGAVPKALLLVGFVVLVTAFMTGGAGMYVLGGETVGGKRYVSIGLGILGFFVLANQRIPPSRAMFFVSIFFLASSTAILSEFAVSVPFLKTLVPVFSRAAGVEFFNDAVLRVGTLGAFATGLCLFLLARYGMRGLLDPRRPWRFCLLLLVLVAEMFSGFRSVLVLLGLTCVVMFVLDGLHRTWHMLFCLALSLVTGLLLIGYATQLPMTMQRTLSILPIKVDPVARNNAEVSSEWRREMWRQVWPQVGQYFFLGKGYALSPGELYMASVDVNTGFGYRAEVAAVAGDYHNGPMTVAIPFGIWGVLAWSGFLVVSIRLLYGYTVRGRPELLTINRLLLAFFVARTITYVLVVGSFYVDFPAFTGLVGLAVSLNGELPSVAQPETKESREFELLAGIEEGEV